MSLSDEQLIVDYLKGDEKSLEILIERYLKPIYGFVYRYANNSQEAEDITQEVFVRMWRNLKRFKSGKKFSTWIFAIAKNAAIDFLRKKKFIPFEDELIETLADQGPLPEEILQKAQDAKILNAAVKKLPINYQAILFLYYNDHFNFREIAEILQEPLNTAKSRHRRGLILLKKELVCQTPKIVVK